MTCLDNHEWTIEFPNLLGSNGPPEFRPNTLSLNEQRRKLDFMRAKFEVEVGELLKPHTRQRDGLLRERHPVHVKLNGDRIKTMMFTPDGVRYGDNFTHMRLYDYQQALDSGTVDKEWGEVTLREAYEYAFEQRDDNGLYNDIKFSIRDELEDITLVSAYQAGGNQGLISGVASGVQTAADETEKMIEGRYAVEFDSLSPLKAMWKLNDEYRLQTWTDEDQNLWVGIPEASADRHIAAPDDERVWHYSSVNISHPREPIQTVVVRGSWTDQPGWNLETEIGNWGDWFNPFDGESGGDVRATGIAQRTDIDHGITYEKNNTSAKSDSIEDVARTALLEEMKNQNSGNVRIEPAKSGDFTDISDLGLGDSLHVVPNDDAFSYRGRVSSDTGQIGDDPDPDRDEQWCGQVVQNEVYTVQGIRHRVDGSGHYTVTIDVSLWPYDIGDMVGTDFLYYHPESDKYLSEDEATNHGIETL